MTTALSTLTSKLASRLDIGGDGRDLLDTLKSTAFKGGAQVSDAQMTALMVVANQYGLNPWTKEIYAFPDKGGIVPVVGVDGWARIINQHEQFDGIEFDQNDDTCTCRIFRKDRSRPVVVTEYMDECKRATQPWNSHPRRMLRHKAMIQCARLAFGYVGIYDTDEAERIVEKDMGHAEVVKSADSDGMTRADKARAAIADRRKETVHVPAVTVADLAEVVAAIQQADTTEAMASAAKLSEKLSDDDKKIARKEYKARLEALKEQQAKAEEPAVDPDDDFLKGLERGEGSAA